MLGNFENSIQSIKVGMIDVKISIASCDLQLLHLMDTLAKIDGQGYEITQEPEFGWERDFFNPAPFRIPRKLREEDGDRVRYRVMLLHDTLGAESAHISEREVARRRGTINSSSGPSFLDRPF